MLCLVGHEDDRRDLGPGHSPDLVRNFPITLVLNVAVHKKQVIIPVFHISLFGQLQRAVAACRILCIQSCILEQHTDPRSFVHILSYDKESVDAVFAPEVVRRAACFLKPQTHEKRSALSQCALHRDRSAHLRDELPAHGNSET